MARTSRYAGKTRREQTTAPHLSAHRTLRTQLPRFAPGAGERAQPELAALPLVSCVPPQGARYVGRSSGAVLPIGCLQPLLPGNRAILMFRAGNVPAAE